MHARLPRSARSGKGQRLGKKQRPSPGPLPRAPGSAWGSAAGLALGLWEVGGQCSEHAWLPVPLHRGIRNPSRVLAMKRRCPRPLDERDIIK